MNEAVLDASVVVKWYVAAAEDHVTQARVLRERFEEASLIVVVPSLLFLEVLNVAGRRWQWKEPALLDLAAELEALALDVASAPFSAIASWTARGLGSYDAAYVALAETLDLPLVTADDRIVSAAGPLAVHLSEVS